MPRCGTTQETAVLKTAMERMMKVQEVILKAVARKLKWWEAAEIIGISDRTMRRWRERYQEHGYDGLCHRQKGKPSPKRVALATGEEVLSQYPERYFDFNLRHFHEKLQGEHKLQLSYTWVKQALQGAGLAKKDARRRPHRMRRPRRAMRGNAAAYRWQQAPVVSGRPLARLDRGDGRRHQRYLMRTVGGGRIDTHGDGRAMGGDPELGNLRGVIQ